MSFIRCFLVSLLVSLSWASDDQLSREDLNELLTFDCQQATVTLHIFSAKPNPVWTINRTYVGKIKTAARKILQTYDRRLSPANVTTRIMGYHGFTISCSADKQLFIHGLASLEEQLLDSGRSHLSPTVLQHVTEYLGRSVVATGYVTLTRINCEHVPIKGSDKVPVYNPLTGNGGCFVKKQSRNNCYAYGTNIVTNTFPQPGRYSGNKISSLTCEAVRKLAVLDGLVYNGTTLPRGHPKLGHFVALLIWPNADYHWTRKDANGYWSHKPGAGPITNKDNSGSLILNPAKSNLAPWKLFCGYYIAQPSKINIR